MYLLRRHIDECVFVISGINNKWIMVGEYHLKIVICVNLLVTLFNFSIYFHSDGADVLKCLLASKADSNESSNVKYIVAFSAVLYNLILPVTVIVCFVLRNM